MKASAGFFAFFLLVGTLATAGCFHQKAGSSADEYLQASPYSAMLIEIDYQQGKAPSSSAVELLKQRIGERCHKPDGVVVEQKAFADSDDRWSIKEIRALEARERDRDHGGNTAVLYVLFLGGGYESDTSTAKVLGVAFGPSSIALFKDNIAAAANPANPLLPLPFTATDVERSVIVHEFGHVLGLVNLGTPMVRDHEDKDSKHRGHSANKDSVMYWAVESSVLSQVFNGPPPTQFDADDIADLRAVGGK